MNNIRENLFGLDKTIQSVQKDLYNELAKVWAGDIEGYGRVYKNLENTTDDIPKYYKSSKIFIPEWYNASKKDYEDLYYNDNKSASFCFLTSDRDDTEDSLKYTTRTKVAFMVDLSKIYLDENERLDERAHRDVVEILRNFSFNKYQITGIEKGVDFVFNGYSTMNIRFDDMHPQHCFSVNLDLEYYLTDKCL